jgi:hypothetical protein
MAIISSSVKRKSRIKRIKGMKYLTISHQGLESKKLQPRDVPDLKGHDQKDQTQKCSGIVPIQSVSLRPHAPGAMARVPE